MCIALNPVSDPAYPASRQTVYLGVAQPRGLVVLKGAGTINSSVREFISEELKIKVEVPALEVFPDGSLSGGTSSAGEDLLKAHLHLGDTDPNVVLGPDSVGTLSFTSGSTGIPKGVRGRHFSLTHFFPWMGERFGLNETAKFTMLSGIAHDPIQRDSELLFLTMRPPAQIIFQCSPLFSSVLSYMYQPQTTSVHPVAWPNGWQTQA